MGRFDMDVRCSTFDVQTRMTGDLSAAEVRALLQLEPHATCGFVRVTSISNQRIAPGGLPGTISLMGGQPGPALYFMVSSDAPCDSIAFATTSFITVTWAIRLKF